MKIEIELNEEQSKKVANFWKEHGSFGGAMFAQPKFSRAVVKADGRDEVYVVSIAMFTPAETERIEEVLSSINASRTP
jgi:hypothetical protein